MSPILARTASTARGLVVVSDPTRPGYTAHVEDSGVVGHALEVVAIDETRASVHGGGPAATFSQAEIDYARSKPDPERRLAARLAAKRAACAALGGDLAPTDFEVVPARGGPPRLALSPRALAHCRRLGGSRVLVSLTHGLTHAAAAVLVVADE